MPFAILSYVMLWFMPQDSMSQAFSVPWFLVAACMFETLMSVSESSPSHPPIHILVITHPHFAQFSSQPTHTI